MVTSKVFQDCRRQLDDGTYPIKIRVNHYGAFNIKTQLYCRSGEFKLGQFVGTNAREKNILLRKMTNEVERSILILEDNGAISAMSNEELRKYLVDALDPNKVNRNKVISIFKEYEPLIKAFSTKMLYKQTHDKLEEYDKNVTWLQLNKTWLMKFDAWMIRQGLSVNSRSIHMRNLRTLCNYALDNHYTTVYPFKGFTIKNESTRHRALTLQQLQAVRDCNIEDYQQPYKDAFMLSFYLIGMNPADMFGDKTTIHNGRVRYPRAKTSKQYDIKIQPEAYEILKRYDFNMKAILGGRSQEVFKVAVNRDLKKFSWCKVGRFGLGGRKIRVPIESELSMYWARHTWATIAHHAGVDKDTISLALGHSFGTRITDVYIEYDRSRVDEANRKVLDYIKK